MGVRFNLADELRSERKIEDAILVYFQRFIARPAFSRPVHPRLFFSKKWTRYYGWWLASLVCDPEITGCVRVQIQSGQLLVFPRTRSFIHVAHK